MNAWKLEAGRCITTPDGTFYLTYGRTTDGSNAPRFRDPAELDRIARQVAVLPELIAALQAAHEVIYSDKSWADSDTLDQINDALAKVEA